MNGIKKFKKAMSISIMYRAWMIMTCRKHMIRHKYLNDSFFPTIHDAPEPTLIFWKNLGYSKLS